MFDMPTLHSQARAEFTSEVNRPTWCISVAPGNKFITRV